LYLRSPTEDEGLAEKKEAETDAIRAETKVMREKRMEASMNAWQEETMAC
jgi:hypothetical protein